MIKAFYHNCIFTVSVLTGLAGIIFQRSEFQFLTSNCYLNVPVLNLGNRLTVPVVIPGTACFSYYQDIITAFAVFLYPVVRILLTVFMNLLYWWCVFSTQVIKCLGGIWHQSRGECHSGREAMTFLYWKDQSTSCQGSPDPRHCPVNTVVCQSRDGKATAGNTLPTVVAWNVTSYQTFGRWHMRLYVAAYVMTRRYKSSCALVPRSLFVSPADRST